MSLPTDVQQMIEADQLSAGHAKVILGLVTPAAQLNLAQQIVKDQLSVREAEQLVQAHAEARKSGRRPLRVPLRSDLEERLQKRFGTRVDVQKRRRGGKIVIHYFSPEELDGVVERLLN